jgi:hypothetical protein
MQVNLKTKVRILWSKALLDMTQTLSYTIGHFRGVYGVGYRKADKMRAKDNAKRSDEINQLIEYVNSRTSEALDAKKRGERFTSLQELQAAQQPVMNRIWDNADDEVWNGL